MSVEFEYPEQIDRELNWPLGTTTRLVRRQRLPHYRLPDGSVRLRIEEVKALVSFVPPAAEGNERRPVSPAVKEGD
jgi:hypothetical protein